MSDNGEIDIVEELREYAKAVVKPHIHSPEGVAEMVNDAADTIERLRADVFELERSIEVMGNPELMRRFEETRQKMADVSADIKRGSRLTDRRRPL